MRILIIDDEENIHRIMVAALKAAKFSGITGDTPPRKKMEIFRDPEAPEG